MINYTVTSKIKLQLSTIIFNFIVDNYLVY
jgi:hypothetical protein